MTFSPLGKVLMNSRESGICSAIKGETFAFIAPVANPRIMMLTINPANAPEGEFCKIEGAAVPTSIT